MKIVRVYNNNAVAILTKDNKEAVIIGSGIGFNKKINDSIDEKQAEKIYYVQSNLQTKFLDLFQGTQEEYFVAAEKILQHAKDLGMEVTAPAIMALTEHISFAIQRFEEGLQTTNLMLQEIKSYYPKEFAIGQWGVRYLRVHFNVDLGENEAGYIALHVINSLHRFDSKETVDTLRFVKHSIICIEELYDIQILQSEFDSMRLITHLKFLAQRVFLKKTLDENNYQDVYELLVEKNQKHLHFADAYKKMVKENFDHELTIQELIYILMHLTKFINN
ncbi:PRD domain-containing protein [Enterococcus aquimarinus]|uniref:PRD domain-containing protein n=1 Tax=Enterococcus aquimarinus TaxID=328396 RepID=A0A1L8QQS4_9ENTE|nr:PRD domain-containing protein [Enterococcus aquimarinus]OJG09875.1 hypothetical protein RU93_GL000514 [Enterococcus aquimarinus]